MSASGDEFDYFPDPFAAGIDWDSVPGLSAVPIPTSHAGLPTLGGTPTPVELKHSSPLVSGEESSTQYSYDEVDAAFLAEIDKAEQRLLQSQMAGPNADRGEGSSTHSNAESELTSRYFHVRHAEDSPSLQTRDPYEREENPHAEGSRGGPSPIPEPKVESAKVVHELSPPPAEGRSHKRRKGKQKESSKKILKEYLSNFEDEMICPICCDIFAFAHLGNPCGHTFCGECGWCWIKKNRDAPSCAICRASLSVDAPMIPNFAVDGAVERHLQALRTSGVEGWESEGTKFVEWQARKARWKADSTKLMARKSATTNLPVFVASYALQSSSIGGAEYERETGSSSGGSRPSSSSDIRREPTNQRRGHGGNRRNRASERHDGRGVSERSGPRVRRSRRRR